MTDSIAYLRRSQIWLATRKNWGAAIVVVLSLVGQTAMTLLQPWPVKSIVDHIIREVPTAGTVTGTSASPSSRMPLRRLPSRGESGFVR